MKSQGGSINKVGSSNGKNIPLTTSIRGRSGRLSRDELLVVIGTAQVEAQELREANEKLRGANERLRSSSQEAIREREMLKRVIDAQEQERQRVARDLHDQLGQQLTALRLKLESLKSKYGAEPAMMKAIDETQRQAQEIDNDVSFLAWELRPTALDNLGLWNALGNYVSEWSKNYDIVTEFHTARLRKGRLLPEIEINIYRIAQEALNNVLKHAKASKVDVMLEYGKRDLVLVVEDDGQGFAPSKKSGRTTKGNGLGLVGMKERAALLGGTLEIESARGKGTTVIARVPIRVLTVKTTTKLAE
jgi:signal transduction histidine kinase